MKHKVEILRKTNIDIDDEIKENCGDLCIHLLRDSGICTLFDDCLTIENKPENKFICLYKRCKECIQTTENNKGFAEVVDYDYEEQI